MYRTRVKFVLILIAILMACGNVSKRKDTINEIELPDKDTYIEFKIDTTINSGPDIDTIYVNLIFKNISKKSILMAEPNRWGFNILPHLHDSTGKEVFPKFRSGRMDTTQTYRDLEVGELYITPFSSLNELYNLTKGGYYGLKFMYNGSILNTDMGRIANNNPIYSNTIEIRIGG